MNILIGEDLFLFKNGCLQKMFLGFIYPEIDEENLNNFYENFSGSIIRSEKNRKF